MSSWQSLDARSSSCCNCKSKASQGRARQSDTSTEQDAPEAPLVDPSAVRRSTDDIRTTTTATTTGEESPWTFAGNRLQALGFPLGGFGTGQILLQGDGSLQGWTIQNNVHNPEYAPLHKLPGNLFGLRVFSSSRDCSLVLQTAQNYTRDNCKSHHGEESHVTAAQVQRLHTLPGIPSLTAKCRYPIATVQYHFTNDTTPSGTRNDNPAFPVQVEMECMTPLIPGNAKDSSMPLAVFTFTIRNTTEDETLDVSLLQSTLNFVGWDGTTTMTGPNTTSLASHSIWGDNVNEPISGPTDSNHHAGWHMTSQNPHLNVTRRGSLSLVAVVNNSSNNKSSITLLQADAMAENSLFHDFSKGRGTSPQDTPTSPPSVKGHSYIGGVVQTITLPPRAQGTCQFVLTWHFPNRPNLYSEHRPNLPLPLLGNRYQRWYPNNSQQVLHDFLRRGSALLEATRNYVRCLYEKTTVPWELLESAAGRLSVMRSPTMFWTRKGLVLGNEGNDCCPLNCTHVYGYTTLLERLYPELAKDMSYSNFVRNFDWNHGCTMRFGCGGFAMDGSLACVIKAFLVVQQADPDLAFLTQVWPGVKRQVQLVLRDATDKDGVIRGKQQNTYDTSMQGANTFIGSYWVTALRVTAIMAALMGEDEFATHCRDKAIVAAEAYERICWKDEFQYYIADVDETNCKHSFGTGCFIDQLSAVGLSLAAGLGNVFDPQHEKAARRAIFHYNQVHKPPFQDLQKHFYRGDRGVRVNTYPHGKLPGCYVYDDLVSTGFSYPVIAAMIHDGNTQMAVHWARQIRHCHSGIHRSPWNEPECGLLYSRAMAAWNLLDQATGFHYNAQRRALRYSPKFSPHQFSTFMMLDRGWGLFAQTFHTDGSMGQITIKCEYGTLHLSSVETEQLHQSVVTTVHARLDGKKQEGVILSSECLGTRQTRRAVVQLPQHLEIRQGTTLVLVFSTKDKTRNATPQTKTNHYRASKSNHDSARRMLVWIITAIVAIVIYSLYQEMWGPLLDGSHF